MHGSSERFVVKRIETIYGSINRGLENNNNNTFHIHPQMSFEGDIFLYPLVIPFADNVFYIHPRMVLWYCFFKLRIFQYLSLF